MASGTTTSRDKTFKLIEVWEQGNLQAQLEDCKRNQIAYEKIAKELKKQGMIELISSVGIKIKN